MAAPDPANEKPLKAPTADAERPRRPYSAPRLRPLGSVRELAFGSSNKFGEGGKKNM